MKNIKTAIVICLVTSGLFAGASSPKENCTDIKKDSSTTPWMRLEDFKTKLTNELGYKISKVKVKEKYNCYEVYGKDKDGNEVECFFNPTNAEKKYCE